MAPAKKTKKKPEPRNLKKQAPGCAVVGIGASAGGLEAFLTFLRNLPSNSGMAFVYIQHQAPDHPSSLPELLSKATRLRVTEAADDMKVEPNNIYVAPHNKVVGLQDHHLKLVPRSTSRMPIDYFFESLARELGSKAVAVILSGTASDGTIGLKAVKDQDGITVAQSLKTAKYDGMPRSAILSGHVDFALSPDEMPSEIMRIMSHPDLSLKELKEGAPTAQQEILDKIYKLLQTESGVDFTYYKPKTIMRRLSRRMLFAKTTTIEEYYQLLRGNQKELRTLYDDILINVTGFFRDPEVFESLKKEILPKIVKRGGSEPIRIWVPGCSTGEEAYSIAIAILEYLNGKSSNPSIQIFGTDVSESMINKARVGVYPSTIAQDVSQARLKRFFIESDHTYQVNKTVRDLCIFARHNVVKDPPFSKLDIISCRNLLIYFGPVLQRRVVPVFNYALRPNGYLILGSTESIAGFANYFIPADRKYKIYSKKTVTSRFDFQFDLQEGNSALAESAPTTREPATAKEVLKEGDRLLLNRYAPASVIVNENWEILQFRGDTAKFLQPGQGQASLNLLKMAKEGLMMSLRSSLLNAKKSNKVVKVEDLKININGSTITFQMEVIPFAAGRLNERFFLVLFDHKKAQLAEIAAPKERTIRKKQVEDDGDEIPRLRREVASTREYLESIIQEQEATNEELRAANEEILSSNEEMQSTNEEMETAKEELQSANEELTTLNEELQNRNIELNLLNNDLTNILSCIQFPILMVEPDLRIRRFTPSAEKVLNLIPSDVGRPITDLNMNIAVSEIGSWINEVIRNIQMKEHEVQDRSGHWYKVQIRPYTTLDNRIDGAVLAFVDIHELKTKVAIDFLVEHVPQPLAVLSPELRVQYVNEAFTRKFQIDSGKIFNAYIHSLKEFQIPNLKALLTGPDHRLTLLEDYRTDLMLGSNGTRKVMLSAKRLPLNNNAQANIVLTITDITPILETSKT
jgi:two-component system, chemotaxis family, CheB/CheR fusion protein